MEQQQAAAEQHTAGGGGNAAEARRRAKQAAGVVPMQNADWTGLDWIGSIDEWLSVAANGGPVAPPSQGEAQIQSD